MTRQEEVDRNFAFFQTRLPLLLQEHLGKFALIRNQEIQGYFDTIIDAEAAGSRLYNDKVFSIQQVTDQTIDLGFFSHAMHLGNS